MPYASRRGESRRAGSRFWESSAVVRAPAARLSGESNPSGRSDFPTLLTLLSPSRSRSPRAGAAGLTLIERPSHARLEAKPVGSVLACEGTGSKRGHARRARDGTGADRTAWQRDRSDASPAAAFLPRRGGAPPRARRRPRRDGAAVH